MGKKRKIETPTNEQLEYAALCLRGKRDMEAVANFLLAQKRYIVRWQHPDGWGRSHEYKLFHNAQHVWNSVCKSKEVLAFGEFVEPDGIVLAGFGKEVLGLGEIVKGQQ
jgi:hypothetical protein